MSMPKGRVARCQKNSPTFERCVQTVLRKEVGTKVSRAKAFAVCSVSVCGAKQKLNRS